MQIRRAAMADIATVKRLEQQAAFDEFSASELQQGISGEHFDESQLTQLIKAGAIWLLERDSAVLGYLVFAQFGFHQASPLYRELIRQAQRNDIVLNYQKLTVCGPVWLAQAARGTGAFQRLFHAAKAETTDTVIALVAEHNERSLKAHCQYAGMHIADFMTLCERDFYLLQCD